MFIKIIILVALFSTFTKLFFNVVGVTDYIQTKGFPFLSKVANCDFCLSFWINFVISAVVAFTACDPFMIMTIPFFATPITLFLCRH